MRVATWNVERPAGPKSASWAVVSGQLDEVNRQHRPDAWVLTEIRAALSPGSDFDCTSESTPAPDRTTAERWVSIWVRRGLHAEGVPLRAEPERTACVRLEFGDRPLLLIGTVLPWRADARRDPVRGAEAFVAAMKLQMAEWDDLRSVNPDASLCVAGDLNQELQGRIYVGSREGWDALSAGLVERKLRCLTGGDSDPLHRRGWRSSIDHIIVSSDLQASDLQIWPATKSLSAEMPDHYGVTALLSVA
jgi:endonuclease/exonuclease/phosphatase family metal-dependent hydrolase